MSNVGHTPGPWFMEEPSMGFSELYANDDVIFGIAYARKDERCEAECDANARLVAAAPELLDALQGILAITDRKHAAWDKARAAIAKAEGVQ